jgi:hypothetical protein
MAPKSNPPTFAPAAGSKSTVVVLPSAAIRQSRPDAALSPAMRSPPVSAAIAPGEPRPTPSRSSSPNAVVVFVARSVR